MEMECQKLKIDPNYLLRENLDDDDVVSIGGESQGKGESSDEEEGKVFRHSLQVLKGKIQSVMRLKRDKVVFDGVEELIRAAEQPVPGKGKALLRQGQIIFATVSVDHHKGTEGTLLGCVGNLFAPIETFITQGNMRRYAYLHAAVYAGSHRDRHYVIENAGRISANGVGMIQARPFEDAFEEDAQFFVLSPPKDSKDKSRRYLVLQRALASLGLHYKYHMRAVSCEAFSLALLNMNPDYESIQADVIGPSKGQHQITDEKREEDAQRFAEFHQELSKRIGSAPKGNILTLRYYLDSVHPKRHIERGVVSPDAPYLNKEHPGWFTQMEDDYAAFFEAAGR